MTIENEFSSAFALAFDPTTAADLESGPCSWPISYAKCADTKNLDSLSDEDRVGFETMAAEYLWNWTGRRFGLCSVVARPCRAGCDDRLSSFWGSGPYPRLNGTGWFPMQFRGEWYNVRCGSCSGSCACAAPQSLALPGPIFAVSEVKIDGVVLDPSAYRVDFRRWLVRLDGGSWPACQDLLLPSTEENTFEVTYERGTPVPVGGQYAAGLLANELALGACGDSSCQLPQRVQSITRQGVTVAVLDAFDDVKQGHTGIWTIDSWLSSVNNAPRGASVLSPDVPTGRR